MQSTIRQIDTPLMESRLNNIRADIGMNNCCQECLSKKMWTILWYLTFANLESNCRTLSRVAVARVACIAWQNKWAQRQTTCHSKCRWVSIRRSVGNHNCNQSNISIQELPSQKYTNHSYRHSRAHQLTHMSAHQLWCSTHTSALMRTSDGFFFRKQRETNQKVDNQYCKRKCKHNRL